MAKQQIHQRLSKDQVILILEKYLSREIDLNYALVNLDVSRSRFFDYLKSYREDADNFTINTPRNQSDKRKINQETEKAIMTELGKEKALIENRDMPIKFYNYSSVRDDILEKFNLKVSVPTIINRAKNNSFYIEKPDKKIHDREVITNFAGELVQHDSSHHLWSPFMEEKLYLITTIDDYSRFLLFADLFAQELSWYHILAIESVILKHGCPLKYYPDQHSIFRYVKDRDKFTPWHTYTKFTDDVNTQWKQVLEDCNIKVTYALSPQAKGKVERPYQWIQDRLVRTCAKNGITSIEEIRKILRKLVYQYNYQWVHSTTKKIPAVRLEKAIKEGKTMFRAFKIKEPFKSSKDIFCLRDERTVNCYHKISINTLELKVPIVPIRHKVELRIVPDYRTSIAEIRMWFRNQLVSVQK
ncbi:MAG: hypothetical protein V1768_02935, partial [Patescibacteria group bacterium]